MCHFRGALATSYLEYLEHNGLYLLKMYKCSNHFMLVLQRAWTHACFIKSYYSNSCNVKRNDISIRIRILIKILRKNLNSFLWKTSFVLNCFHCILYRRIREWNWTSLIYFSRNFINMHYLTLITAYHHYYYFYVFSY